MLLSRRIGLSWFAILLLLITFKGKHRMPVMQAFAIGKIMKILIYFILTALLMNMGCTSSPSRYDKARELYKQGPKKGLEIVSLLRAHILDNPKDEKAIRLLAITLFGIEKPAEALPVLDQAIDLTSESDEIAPSILMLKARALYDLDRKYECKRILEIYWAFWQNDEELKKLYDWYYPRVKDMKEPTNGEQHAQQ